MLLSEDPLFTAVAVVEAFPLASRYITTFCATAVGLMTSFTVTVAVAVEELLLASVTVSVTGLETLPRIAVIEVLGGDRVKVPAGLRIVRATFPDVLL